MLRQRRNRTTSTGKKSSTKEVIFDNEEVIIEKNNNNSNNSNNVCPSAVICDEASVESDPKVSSTSGNTTIGTTTLDVSNSSITDDDMNSQKSSSSDFHTFREWTHPYNVPPYVTRSTVLIIGIGIFVLAVIWPPLLLLVTYIASKLIPYSFRENDDAAKRRILYHRFINEADDLPERFRNIHNYVNLEETYWTNQRGMVLLTNIMTPKDKPIKAVVCFCHGYSDHVSYGKLVENQRFCDHGIAFVAIEYEGHGRSDGPMGLIDDWDALIDDVAGYFKHIATTQKRFHNLPFFLMGESMGGAVSYCVYNRIPDIFTGVVFVCPMCKISDDMLPPQYVIDFLIWLIGPSGTTSFIGFLPIAPSKNDLNDVVNRIKEKGIDHCRCPLLYNRNPRLATARELINITQRISNNLSEFNAPFLVLHGLADRVTDPNLSKALYKESCSTDKSIQLYDGMWHALTSGEPDDNIDRVYNDIISWIQQRI